MILLTVGTQLSFDRLTIAVDNWLSNNDIEVVGQIGPSRYVPKNFRHKDFFDPSELDDLVSSASLVISHAGMGSIITALAKGKPIIIVPRQAKLGEHRNDHQVATARKFATHQFVRPVFNVDDIWVVVSELMEMKTSVGISEFAPDTLISELKKLIDA